MYNKVQKHSFSKKKVQKHIYQGTKTHVHKHKHGVKKKKKMYIPTFQPLGIEKPAKIKSLMASRKAP